MNMPGFTAEESLRPRRGRRGRRASPTPAQPFAVARAGAIVPQAAECKSLDGTSQTCSCREKCCSKWSSCACDDDC